MPPGSGGNLQSAKKGVMEIADLILVSKYDTNFVHECNKLKRKVEDALTLTSSKHLYLGESEMSPASAWNIPVELVSALENYNIDSIWQHV